MDWSKVRDDASSEPLILIISEMAAIRALELAGNRLKGEYDRSYQSALNKVPRWDAHTIVRAEEKHLDKILEGAWEIPRAVGVPEPLLEILDVHVRAVLTAGIPYSREDLKSSLRRINL
jgi:hypothetical protein